MNDRGAFDRERSLRTAVARDGGPVLPLLTAHRADDEEDGEKFSDLAKRLFEEFKTVTDNVKKTARAIF